MAVPNHTTLYLLILHAISVTQSHGLACSS